MAYEDDVGNLSQQKSNSVSSGNSLKTKQPLDGVLVDTSRTTEDFQHSDDGLQRLVFTDPVAFRYLQEDPSTKADPTGYILSGYEIYIVEQWACSRMHPTFVINTYTHDPAHQVSVNVLSVPTDENLWSPRLKVYFNAMSQFHARRHNTLLGILMVTNLSSFPSSLTVISVPDGDVKKHRKDYIVNEDLKRLGCSGRAGLNLKPPTPATEAKFYQLYRTSERVPFYDAVMELVRLCQMALTVFGKLPSEYVDGLLCDITERAVNDWWTDIGTDLYNIEPSDGILGPTTVSALLGTLFGARNRLHAAGAPVPKDVFDNIAFKKGISSFQKSQKLDRTRRLDRQTLDRLHRVTAKAAKAEGWTVPRAVKSTVAELGGKGGEMVMGIVGARDKAGISEVETLDIVRFVQLVQGDRAKWLWHGKQRKTGGHDNDDGMVYMEDDQGGYVWANKRRDNAADYTSGRPSLENEPSLKQSEASGTTEDRDSQLKAASKKLVAGKVSDARAGLGRIRDTVHSLRSHQYKSSKSSIDVGFDQLGPGSHLPIREIRQTKTTHANPVPAPILLKTSSEPIPHDLVEVDIPHSNKSDIGSQVPGHESHEKLQTQAQLYEIPFKQNATPGDRPTIEDEVVPGVTPVKRLFKRSRSCVDFRLNHPMELPDRRDTYWPRHLSFSAVEDAILPDGFARIGSAHIPRGALPSEAILYEDIAISDASMVEAKLKDLANTTTPWVESQIGGVESIGDSAQSQLDDLTSIYQDKLQQYNSLRADATHLIANGGGILTERAKTVELLGAKFDYEIKVMESRMNEVEQGLEEYERNIAQLERRVQNLVQVDEEKSSSAWIKWGLDLFRRGQEF